MSARLASFLAVVLCLHFRPLQAEEKLDTGGRLPGSGPTTAVWWALSSAAKILPQDTPPSEPSPAIEIRCARNERESVQVLVRPTQPLKQVSFEVAALTGPGQQSIAPDQVEILQVLYLDVSSPTEQNGQAGLWPDPLLPVRGALDLQAGVNHNFWVRVHVPRQAAPGSYRGALRLRADQWQAELPIALTVYDFALPDQMSCQTAFGFSPEEVFRFHGLKTDADKRQVLDKYWANLAAHHVSPYDPAPLDPIQVTWPDVHPPKTPQDNWLNLRRVSNESHGGKSALLAYDDKTDANLVISYQPLIPIPPKGLHVRGWYRTAIPGHRFTVALNHHDAEQKWMSGRNRDVLLEGSGQWQCLDQTVTEFPPGAKFVSLHLMAAAWTDAGEKLGLVWYDDISIQDAETGAELVQGGDFEQPARTDLCAPADQLAPKFDFSAWDAAMARAFNQFHFNSFSVPISGLGGGTFHELSHPSLRGFEESAPEYPLLLGSYCRQMESHLRAKGWLGPAFVYWFDEPSPDQYPFLQKGFAKLKQFCPDLPRMVTKLVEPGLIGGPNLWCPISNEYNPDRANDRRKLGERFWWYVCTAPKAPYAGLFLDHRAPELRIWLWQTFQRNIQGILVWQINYWNSDTAYPNPNQPQNPYQDPMSWMTGYGTPKGQRSPWGNGDGRFLYPPLAAASGHPDRPILDGPVDSIRWEHLRDGIEDYEYLTLLQQKLTRSKGRLKAETQRAWTELLSVPPAITKSMTEFTAEGTPIELRRHQIARALEQSE